MPRSLAETSKRALGRIQRLCCLGIGGEMLVPDLMSEVIRLIPSHGGVFFWLDPNLHSFTNAYSTFPPSIIELYLREFHQTPRERDLIHRYRDMALSKQVFNTEQCLRVDRHTFRRTDFYNLLFRPAHVNEVIALWMAEGAALHIYRADGEKPFEGGDLKLLKGIADFVSHGLKRATLEEEHYLVDGDDRALFIADLEGSVRHANTQALRLMKMALARADGHSDLVERAPEIAQLCYRLVATANGQIGQPPPVLRLRNPWGEFVLRAYWLEPTDGAEQTRYIGITIARRVPRALALRRRVEDLPLTGREKQLCLLLAHA